MARSITKKVASATIYGFNADIDFEIGDDGFPIPNVTIECDGNPTENKARILLEKKCNTKNVMLIKIEVDETKINVDPNDFYLNSSLCVDGENYDRNFVTKVFKITSVGGFYFADGKNGDKQMHSFSDDYVGVTTDNKLLNYYKDVFDSSRLTITTTDIHDEKRFMLKSEYLKLAK